MSMIIGDAHIATNASSTITAASVIVEVRAQARTPEGAPSRSFASGRLIRRRAAALEAIRRQFARDRAWAARPARGDPLPRREWLVIRAGMLLNPNAFKTDLGWNDLDFIRNASGLPVLVKGVTTPQDAAAAVKAGAVAVQVSNHGGRALDGTPAAITVPRIADAVQGDVPIILDSGVRRGMDVAKALAVGADAVAVGRPVWWSLALGGAGGVAGLMAYFNQELVNTTLHLGATSVSALGPRARDQGARVVRLGNFATAAGSS